MGIPVLILGESGAGKSASLRNFAPEEIGIFNVASKPLPFRKKMRVINGASYDKIKERLPQRDKDGRFPNDYLRTPSTTASTCWPLSSLTGQKRPVTTSLRILRCTFGI